MRRSVSGQLIRAPRGDIPGEARHVADHLGLVAVLMLLLLSIPSMTLIPFGPFLGLDLHNLDVFHDCAVRDHPYLGTGSDCGDIESRDMVYPPLLYWSFAWLRLLPFSIAAPLWGCAVLIGTALSLTAWARLSGTGRMVGVFVGLMVLQFPSLFAAERGNSDVLVLVAWTAAAGLFASGRLMLAGLVAGLTASLKAYPVFACGVVLIGLLRPSKSHPGGRRDLVMFGSGLTLAGLLAGLLFLDQNIAYVREQLPRFAARTSGLSVHSHALAGVAELQPIASIISLSLLVVWSASASRVLGRDPAMVFAGALAISTYFAPTSYDYNLITTYPLLILLFVRSFSVGAIRADTALLLLGLLGVVGHRGLFNGSGTAKVVHIGIQVLWLMAAGLVACVATPGSSGKRARWS